MYSFLNSKIKIKKEATILLPIQISISICILYILEENIKRSFSQLFCCFCLNFKRYFFLAFLVFFVCEKERKQISEEC
jgi:hypothetical protein